MYRHDHDMSGWGYGVMAVIMLLLLALIIFAVLVAARYFGRTSHHTPTPPPERPAPEQLLAERLARGEIDADEYRRGLDTLRSGPGPTSG